MTSTLYLTLHAYSTSLTDEVRKLNCQIDHHSINRRKWMEKGAEGFGEINSMNLNLPAVTGNFKLAKQVAENLVQQHIA